MNAVPSPPGPRWAWAIAILALVLAGAAAFWSQSDLDQDGLEAWTERSIGTHWGLADTDRDSLPDGWEVQRGTRPVAWDTDGDLLDDGEEVRQATDPLSSDSDGDTITDLIERAHGTDPRDPDTDDDGLWDHQEQGTRTDPLAWDTDEDGLSDGQEVVMRSNPVNPDSDGDGLEDMEEAGDGPVDCDGDGLPAVVETDDDDDLLRDADEPPENRCQQDVDGDGLIDGLELNTLCVVRTDCDVDGILDAPEADTRFDRLDPDTFDVGLFDGVSLAFEQAGQPASRDADEDGIPDAWESTQGLIDWGPFDPEPGRKDLLIEFVRVNGPDSARYNGLDLTPSYRRVEGFFETDGGIDLQWVQTRVRLEEETRPSLLPSGQSDYYRDVLARSDHPANPYVTTVVMNPQHDQAQILHLGVAPIRGMLAAVDYGAHTEIRFQAGNGTLTLSPFIESVIEAKHTFKPGGTIQEGGFTDDGRMFLRGEGFTLTWRPFWFTTNPIYRTDEGAQAEFVPSGATVDHDELSDTIAHELGHTLGLCHTDLATCQAGLPPEARGQLGQSTMDTSRPDRGRLHFLQAEWAQLTTYLTCAPVRPITLTSQGASRAEVIDAKYEITLENVLDVRTRDCQDHTALEEDLEQDPSPFQYRPSYPRFAQEELDRPAPRYEPQAGDQEAPRVENTMEGTYRFVALAIGVALAAAATTWAGLSRWERS